MFHTGHYHVQKMLAQGYLSVGGGSLQRYALLINDFRTHTRSRCAPHVAPAPPPFDLETSDILDGAVATALSRIGDQLTTDPSTCPSGLVVVPWASEAAW